MSDKRKELAIERGWHVIAYTSRRPAVESEGYQWTGVEGIASKYNAHELGACEVRK